MKKKGKIICKNLLEFAAAIGVAVFILVFVAGTVRVEGSSMESTYHTGDRLLIWKLGYRPALGDVVVVREENGGDKFLLKRVIAAGGQTVLLDGKEGAVFVDGQRLEEPYLEDGQALSEREAGRTFAWKLSGDEVFVMGDNRAISLDSRIFGPLPQKDVVGKVLLCLWAGK